MIFSELNLNEQLLKAVNDLGFSQAMPIQQEVIPIMLQNNRDIIALAQTGTGKTAAFGLPLLQLINFKSNIPQALILSPTRELCMQIADDLNNYAKYIDGARIVPVYGGANIQTQIKEIKKGVQIIVATPGRFMDLMERGHINFLEIKWVVLDEADEMLSMGFENDMQTILAKTPKIKRTYLFSATMPAEIALIARQYMTNPIEITVGTKNSGAENVEHIYYIVHAKDKYLALKRIADYNPDIYSIVFCRTKIETQEVAEHLIKDGYNADALHGDLSQNQRDNVMNRFRNKTLQMLIATDVAARGIDVDDITHIINYGLPDEIETYIHRSGRTARAGKSGTSIAIINLKEKGKIKQIENKIHKKFIYQKIPTGFEVCEKQLKFMISKTKNITVDEKGIAKYLPEIYEEFKDLSKEDVINLFVSLEFNRFLEYYKKAPDLNVNENETSYQNHNDAKRLFISLGINDNFNKTTLVDYISSQTNIPKKLINNVFMMDNFSFFDIADANLVDNVFSSFRNKSFNKRKIRIEFSQARKNDTFSERKEQYKEKNKRFFKDTRTKSSSNEKNNRYSDNKNGERKSYNNKKKY
jgi:ATP-dependent RNA helicase DeaD